MSEPEAKYVLAELHEDVYGNHPSGQTLAHRAYMQGDYWPTMNWELKAMSKDAIGVNDMLPFLVYLQKSSTRSQVLGHLCNGGLT